MYDKPLRAYSDKHLASDITGKNQFSSDGKWINSWSVYKINCVTWKLQLQPVLNNSSMKENISLSTLGQGKSQQIWLMKGY